MYLSVWDILALCADLLSPERQRRLVRSICDVNV